MKPSGAQLTFGHVGKDGENAGGYGDIGATSEEPRASLADCHLGARCGSFVPGLADEVGPGEDREGEVDDRSQGHNGG